MTQNRWHLDPAHVHQRLDLELSERALEHLERLSARSGRSLHDLAADLLCQAMAD